MYTRGMGCRRIRNIKPIFSVIIKRIHTPTVTPLSIVWRWKKLVILFQTWGACCVAYLIFNRFHSKNLCFQNRWSSKHLATKIFNCEVLSLPSNWSRKICRDKEEPVPRAGGAFSDPWTIKLAVVSAVLVLSIDPLKTLFTNPTGKICREWRIYI